MIQSGQDIKEVEVRLSGSLVVVHTREQHCCLIVALTIHLKLGTLLCKTNSTPQSTTRLEAQMYPLYVAVFQLQCAHI